MQKTEFASGEVAEIQGLYGPFSFPEKLLQQIWSRGDFDLSRAITADGRAVQILYPGNWNHLGGPDFKNARLQIGEAEVTGDVEVHLRAADWRSHNHAADPAYNRVVLHVILFPTDEKMTVGADQTEIPLLVLLPLLNHDLEEYAADEVIERLADHPLAQARRELTQMPIAKLEAELQRCVEIRWRQKVHYAKLRIERLGWDEACHHTALEILGYRFNRAPMLAVAGAWALAEWSGAGGELAETAYNHFVDRWNKQGVRPANRPRTRLRQYARWVAACPGWPRRLAELAATLPQIALREAVQTATVRRAHCWPGLEQRVVETIFCGEIGGTRLNTIVCDGLLPLLAAQKGADGLAGVWYAWPAGDVPAKYSRLLRELGVVDRQRRPLSHGVVQALIGWLLAADERRDESHTTTVGSGA